MLKYNRRKTDAFTQRSSCFHQIDGVSHFFLPETCPFIYSNLRMMISFSKLSSLNQIFRLLQRLLVVW